MSDGAKKEKKRKTKLKVNCKLYFMYVSAYNIHLPQGTEHSSFFSSFFQT